MKRTKWEMLFGLMLLALFAVNAYAASPREQFKQMVEQLQKSPNDTVLREKIIKLAQTLKPAPAVPVEAEKHEGRGQFAFKSAKSASDYLDAAKEYEQAIAAAPWIAGYYSDLCTIYEKAGRFSEAKKNCEWFLATSPTPSDASEVRKQIAGLEYAMDKVGMERRAQEEKLRTAEGVWQGQFGTDHSGFVFEVTNNNGNFDLKYLGADPAIKYCNSNYYKATTTSIEFKLTGSSAGSNVCDSPVSYNVVYCILIGSSTMSCESTMFVNGKKAINGYGNEIVNKYQMIRRTSCRNYRYAFPSDDYADCE